MKTSNKGLELIKRFEGFRSKPYLDAVKVPTIGYGSTYYPDSKKVMMKDYPISEEYATELLSEMVTDFEKGVLKTINRELNQNQFDALVSFSYNLGNGAFASSTLAKRINADPCNPDIKNQFMRWVKAGGRTLAGLVKRREAEAYLYFL